MPLLFQVEEITSESAWKAVQDAWEDFVQRIDANGLFLSPDWFGNSFDNFGSGKILNVLAVRRDETLVGIAPLWRFQESRYGIRLNVLGFISCPDTPFVDLLVDPTMRREVLEAFLDYLYREKGKAWDVLVLHQWEGDSQNFRLFQELLVERRRAFDIEHTSQTPYIPISGSWDSFLQTRSTRFRKSHRNVVNKIHRFQRVEPLCIRHDPDGTAYEILLDVSSRGWKHHKGLAISSREEVRRFFKRLTEWTSRMGGLMVWVLKLDGKAVAVEYDLVWKRKVYALRADFDEDFRTYSPGTYLEYHIIKELFDHGYDEYSTGPGLNAYKLNWTEQLRENYTVRLYNTTGRGLTVWALNRVRFHLKRIRDRCLKR